MSTPVGALATDGQHGLEMLPKEQAQKHLSSASSRKAQRKKDPTAFILKTRDEIASPSSRFYERRIRQCIKWLETRHFVEGNQYALWNWQAKSFVNVQENNDLSYEQQLLILINNRLLPVFRTNLAQITASNPTFQAKPRNDKPESAAAARAFQSYIDFDRDRNEKPSLRQEAASYQMQCGTVVIETYYDPAAGGYVDLPNWQQVVKPGDETYACANCGAAGPMSNLAGPTGQPQVMDIQGTPMVDADCPNPQCQSGPLIHSKTPDTMAMEQQGTFQKQVGVTVRRHRDPIGIIVDHAKKSIPESTFFYEESAVSRHELEALYDWATIPSSPLSLPLRALLSLERSVGANAVPGATYSGNEANSGSAFEMIRFERLWLDRPIYQNIVTDRDVTFGDPNSPNAFVIKTGTCLGDLFSKGLRVYMVGDVILNIQDECKNDRWSSYAWIKNINGFWGADLFSPLVQPQKMYNELYSLEMQSNMANATDTLLYDEQMLDVTQWTGNPTRNSIALRQSVGEGQMKGRAFEVIPAQPIAATVINQKDHIAADIVYLGGVQPIPHDSQNQEMRTATEALQARDMQVGEVKPPMGLRAEGEINALYQSGRLAQQFFVPGQLACFGRYKDYEIKCFLAADLERDVEITYSPGSEVPLTTQDKLLRLSALATFGNAPGGIFNQELFPDPDFRQCVMDAYGDPLGMTDLAVGERIGEIRLQKLQQLVLVELAPAGVFDINQPPPPPDPPGTPPQIGPNGQPIPTAYQKYQMFLQQTVSQIPFQPVSDDHAAIGKVYMEWMNTDDGINAPAFLQQCVLALIAQSQGQIQQGAQQQKDSQLEDATKQGLLAAGPKLLEIGLAGDQALEREKVKYGQQSAQSAQDHDEALQQQAMNNAHEAQQNSQQQQHESDMQDNEPDSDDQ